MGWSGVEWSGVEWSGVGRSGEGCVVRVALALEGGAEKSAG